MPESYEVQHRHGDIWLYFCITADIEYARVEARRIVAVEGIDARVLKPDGEVVAAYGKRIT